MRKLFVSLLTALSFCSAAAEQGDTLYLGYCNGNYNTSPTVQSEGKGYTDAAILLTREALSAYEGNSLVGVRAALVERINTDTLRVWVRSSLTGENLATGYVLRSGTGGITKGWNQVVFDQPLTISHNLGDLYVGYSLHHKASLNAISLIEASGETPSFIRLNKGEWQDYSAKGVVCVEALVAGDHMPSYDLGLGIASVVPAPSYGEYVVKATVQLHNYGTKPTEGFTLALAAGELASQSIHFNQHIEPLADSTLTFTVDMGVRTDENTQWSLSIESIDGSEDENTGNNATVPIYKFLKNVLIEEFTTERCVNCPRVAGYLHAALELEDLRDRVIAVAHHAGYYTDWLTQPCDEELTWFYNNGVSTYAPAMGFNRQPLFETSAGKPTPLTNPTSAEMIAQCCRYEMQQPANAMLDMRLDFNADSTKVSITVGGVCTAAYKTEHPYICLYLLENEIKAKSQEGADGMYMQQHVKRAYNSTWGEPIAWNERRFSYEYDFDIDPSWVKANMEVVAFVYNYDETDPANCAIDNAVAVSLMQHADTPHLAVSNSRSASDIRPVAEYNLNGQRIVTRGVTKGIHIVRMSDGTVRKVLSAKE